MACSLSTLRTTDVGPTRAVGPSHLAIAPGTEAIRAWHSVMYAPAGRSLRRLKDVSDRGLEERSIRAPCYARLLILDEIGYLPRDRTMAHLFFLVVKNGYERAPTIFTSNKVYSE
jgi:DNA replication protein DnaC